MSENRKENMAGYVKSTCSYCGVGCGVLIKKNPLTGEIDLKGDPNHPVNKGMLCSKGMNLHHTVMDQSDRLTVPQMRWNRESKLEEVSWDTALTRAAAVFKGIIANHGPDAVGFYVSGQLLTEEYYLANKIIKGFIKSNNIDTNSRLCMSSAVVGYKKTIGEDTVPISYDDIELADTFLIAGANPAWCHPILFRRLEAHKAANPDIKIICVDPRKTQTASSSDLHLAIAPGTDIYLYNAFAQLLIENGKLDDEFIKNHTDGFEKLKKHAYLYSIEEVASICDISQEDIVLASKWIGEAKGFISMWTMGLNQSSVGVNKNLALINLSLITGHIGKPGSGPFSLTGQPNAMGGREVGGLSTMLAVHKDFKNPQHVKEIEEFWGVEGLSTKTGYTAVEMFDSLLEGKMKAIWIICTNPVVSMPDARRIEAALRKAKFVIVQDISSNSNTVYHADLVLPAAGYMEKTGVMTNSDRRVSLVQKITSPPGKALPDAEILWRFADKMGWKDSFNYSSYEDIYAEYVSSTKGTNIDVTGLSHQRLKESTVQWPYTEKDKVSTPRLFEDKQFFTANKKAQIHGVDPVNKSEKISKNYPLVLTTGRIRDQWHTMTRSGKVSKLNGHIKDPYIEIHPEDAKVRKIKEGDLVDVVNTRGNARVIAKITSTIRSGLVFMPMHWGKKANNDLNRANNLTNPLFDEMSQQPDFKYAAVEISRYRPKPKKIIVIGAGAGATEFVKSYRELGDDSSSIDVFSKEKNPFYNRVLLPDYLSKEKKWEQLIKLKEEEFKRLDVRVHKGVAIVKIDPLAKTVLDSNQVLHEYDTLVVATGSAAFVPPNMPKGKKNFVTIRQKEDIDTITQLLNKGDEVLIVGGGLLGLEMADSFHQIGNRVHVIQLTDRLMSRQLDQVAGDLLYQKMTAKGINIHLNEEVLDFIGEESIESVVLRSGQKLNCKIVICAVGTRPNVNLLKEANIDCGRGVIINEYLQSSDPNIYCIGEIAELNGNLWGITTAAEEQANILAKVIYGNPNSTYSGSVFVNILKMKDIQLCSVGLVEVPEENKEDYQVIKTEDLSRQYYKKCIVYKNKLVGTLLMGDKIEFNHFKSLIANASELNDVRDQLLRTGRANTATPLKGKVICSCNNIGDENILDVLKKFPEADLEKIMECTSAGTGCGSCKPEITELISQKLVDEKT